MLTGEQIRAARALIGWKAKDLADAANISVPTIQRLDSTKGPLSGRYETIEAIKTAFAAAGIQFLTSGEIAQGAGVAMKSEEKQD